MLYGEELFLIAKSEIEEMELLLYQHSDKFVQNLSFDYYIIIYFIHFFYTNMINVSSLSLY